MSASCPGNKPHCGCQQVPLCHGWTGQHCQYYIHTLEMFHTKVTNFLEDSDLIWLLDITMHFSHKMRTVPSWQGDTASRPVWTGEGVTMVTDCFFNMQRAEMSEYILQCCRADPQQQQCPHLKKTELVVIASLTSLFLSHAVLILLTSKHLPLITPLLLFLPLSFSLRLSLSIFPSPLVFFPPPYNQCGF